MTKAWKQIEKIKKGLGDDPEVANALKLANEEVQEWNTGSRRVKGGDGRRKLVKAARAMQTETEHDEDEEDDDDLDEGRMKELHGYIEDGKDAKWIAKKMKLDIKTIQALMNEDFFGDNITEKADRNEVMELKLFIENDPRLYKSKLIPIVKNIQKKMKSGKYDHKKAPKLWMYLVKDGVKLYAKEFDGLKFGKEVEKEVAQQLADEYKDEIDAQGGTMFESKFYLQFSEYRDGHTELDEATGNEIKKYMKAEWKTAVKASKVGSGKYMRASGKIPNEFRTMVIKKFMPDAKILDWKNINYGNIADNQVALRAEEWDKLIKEDVDFHEKASRGKYKIDHKTFTSAVQEALSVAGKAGYEVDEDDYFHTVATGPRKPGEGKTNKYSVALTKKGKPQKKNLQIQIYGKGKHGYELNCYIA